MALLCMQELEAVKLDNTVLDERLSEANYEIDQLHGKIQDLEVGTCWPLCYVCWWLCHTTCHVAAVLLHTRQGTNSASYCASAMCRARHS